MAAAEKALAAKKPILLVKVGRSERGKAATASHTGAIAGDDAVFDAVCRKYGVVRCPSLDDLIESCLAFSQGRLPKGHRIAMAGYSGGAKGLVLDYAERRGRRDGATVARDAGEAAGHDRSRPRAGKSAGRRPGGRRAGGEVRRNLQVCLRRPDGRSRHCAGSRARQFRPILTIRRRCAASTASTDKPVLAFGRMAQNTSDISRKYQSETGVPFIQGLPETVRALQGLARYAAAQRRGVAPLPEPRGNAENLSGDAPRCAAGQERIDRCHEAPLPGTPTRRPTARPRSDFQSP